MPEGNVHFLFNLAGLYPISLAVAYGLGKGPVEEYKYILGLPQWWFAVIVVSVVFTFIVIFLSLFVFQDMELSDVAETGEKKKG